MSIGLDRAKQLIEEGGGKGRALNFMVERPNELLATILVGNNVVNILAASLVTTITARLFASDAIGISTGVTTLVILIFGEIIPKTFARTHAEKLSVFVIFVLRALGILLFPIIQTMVFIIKTVLGENAELTGRMVTKNDIEYMINKAGNEKTMDSKQLDLLNSILEFPTIKVKDIMVSRVKVKFIQHDLTFEEMLELVREDGFSRYPVCEEVLDSTLGFVHVKDLATVRGEGKQKFNIRDIIKEPFFVYEHMKIQAVFDHMNRKKNHMALVKDENGLVVGIVTLEDIIEEIFGEIQDEHDEDEVLRAQSVGQLSGEGVLVDGTISLRDLYGEFDIKIPLNDHYSTLAGFILDMLGNNFPEKNQIIVWHGLSFELMEVENFEIKQVRIKDVDGEKHFFSKKEAQGVGSDEELTDESPNILVDIRES